MISSFDDFTSFQYDDLISLTNGLKTMRHNDYGSPHKEFIESDSDCLFREWIKSRSWFIKQDNLWILQKYLRNSESLFLSSWEPDSPLTDLSINSLLKIEDKVTMSKTEGSNKHLFKIINIFFIYRGNEILSDGRIKYTGILSEISNMWIITLQCCLIEFLIIMVMNTIISQQ